MKDGPATTAGLRASGHKDTMTTGRWRVTHTTAYSFHQRVQRIDGLLHLTPRETATQHLVFHQLVFLPPTVDRTEASDPFGNAAVRFSTTAPVFRLEISANSVVEVEPVPAGPAVTAGEARQYAARMAESYLEGTRLVPTSTAAAAFAADLFDDARSLRDALAALRHRIYDSCTYDRRATGVDTDAATVLSRRRGVCQDFAHLALSVLRSQGIAARYVSGYLDTRHWRRGPHRVAADLSHAWIEAAAGDGDWIAVDPTLDVAPDLHHIVCAWGRDYADVMPVSGSLAEPTRHRLRVAVDVQPA